MARTDEPKILQQDGLLRGRLQEANKTIPRYLFRMWHRGSGGDTQLNTIDTITPHAFLNRRDHPVVYDMTAEQFIDNTTRHLLGNYTVVSEFSSWSASLKFVLRYATTQRFTAYIAVVDTLRLQNGDANATSHVPALKRIFGHHESCQNWNNGRGFDYGRYDWEYLVHGVVQGKAYKAVPFDKLCWNGLLNYLPELRQSVDAWHADRDSLPDPVVPFDVREFRQLKTIAELFVTVSRFQTVMSIVLYCCKKRSIYHTYLGPREQYEISFILGDRDNVPHNWYDLRLRWFKPKVYDYVYEDTQHMIDMMQKIHTYCWGSTFDSITHVKTRPYDAKFQHPQISSGVLRLIDPDEHVYSVPDSILPHPLGNMTCLWRFPGMSGHIASHRKAVRNCPKGRFTWIRGSHVVEFKPDGKLTMPSLSRGSKAITFQTITKDYEIYWFARIDPESNVHVNGQHYFCPKMITIGPIPAFSVWRFEDRMGCMYIDAEGLNYGGKMG
ncbi:hypothetical protein KCU65_g8918, partial [Aureobasidium melanogenum]